MVNGKHHPSMKRGCNLEIIERVFKVLPSWCISTSLSQFIVDSIYLLSIDQTDLPTKQPNRPSSPALQYEVLSPCRHCCQLGRRLGTRFLYWRWSLLIAHQRRYARNKRPSRGHQNDHSRPLTNTLKAPSSPAPPPLQVGLPSSPYSLYTHADHRTGSILNSITGGSSSTSSGASASSTGDSSSSGSSSASSSSSSSGSSSSTNAASSARSSAASAASSVASSVTDSGAFATALPGVLGVAGVVVALL